MKCVVRLLLFVLILAMASGAEAAVSTFDDLSLAPSSYWNGSDHSGSDMGTYSGFTSGGNYFVNFQYSDWNFWEGFAYSNMTNTTTAGYTNQFSAITGKGVNGSANYAVAFTSAWFQPAQTYNGVASGNYAQTVAGFYATNTTYAYLSMLNGDSFAKAFAAGDWFLLTVYGLDANYEKSGSSVGFYLADFRPGTGNGYILKDWTWVDLTGLGPVYGLEFELTSSDTGSYGMNTPAYFAMDDLTTAPVPIPGVVWLLGSGLAGLAAIRNRQFLTRKGDGAETVSP
jgi:hypothetical protein